MGTRGLNELKRQVMRFTVARNFLPFVVAFTAINLLLTAFEANGYFLFSATVPLLIFAVGQGFAEAAGNNIFLTIGLILAFIIVAMYFACWLFGKRTRAFIIAALVLFSIDCLFYVWYILNFGLDGTVVPELIFHGIIICYLISGTAAWSKLRGVSADEFDAIQRGFDPWAVAQPGAESAARQNEGEEYGEEGGEGQYYADNESVPLRADYKKGRILIAAEYEGLQISMKRTYGLMELIVDGYVYDEIKGVVEYDYSLIANLRG
ncbi:MAG: hypothetical protein FWE85_02200, partial [Clostridiales bacterium]|nr:hypothetical protein [Clostridiales bacterium]